MCCYSKQLRIELDWFRWLYPTKAGSPQSLNRGKGGGGTSGGGKGIHFTFQHFKKTFQKDENIVLMAKHQ